MNNIIFNIVCINIHYTMSSEAVILSNSTNVPETLSGSPNNQPQESATNTRNEKFYGFAMKIGIYAPFSM